MIKAEVVERSEPATALPSRLELDLDHVANLTLVGNALGAFQTLESIAGSAAHPRDHTHAWCYGVELAVSYGDAERCRLYLSEAVRAAEAIVHDEDSLAASAELETASAMQSWLAGDVRSVSAASKHAARAASRLSRSSDPATARLAVGTLLHAANCALWVDEDPGAAVRLVGDARRVLHRFAHRPSDLLASLLVTFGTAQWFIDGQMERSFEYLGEALAVLQSARMTSDMPRVMLYLCDALVMCGDAERARNTALDALKVIDATGSVHSLLHAYSSLSTVETARGDSASGLAFAERARQIGSSGFFEPASMLATAEAHLAARRFDRALSFARAIRTPHGITHSSRLLGKGLRIEAEAQEGLGNLLTASELIDEAITVLARYGHQGAKQRAYAASARITGRAEHCRIRAGSPRRCAVLAASTIRRRTTQRALSSRRRGRAPLFTESKATVIGLDRVRRDTKGKLQ